MIYINTFYVDESGSMTKKYASKNRYFVICIIMVCDNKRLKQVYKRFVSSNINKLKELDGSKMFYKSGKFKELKGSSFNFDMKEKFVNYFCKNDLFNIYYICLDNIHAYDYFYKNTSRAFNYLLKLCIEYNTNSKLIPRSYNFFYIDERDVRTDTRLTLCEYLNTELVIASHIQNGFTVEYCHSESKELIQIADVFSNLYYSYLRCDKYNDLYKKIYNLGYIKNEFYFPFKM